MACRPCPARALVVALLCLAAAGCNDGMRVDADHMTVVLDGHTFRLEVAADNEARIQGLKGVAEIPADGGMIFTFPEARVQSFWMADCLTDMDIIFADPQGRVTATHHMKAEAPRRSDETRAAYEARMPGYSSVYPAQFAIELRAGWLDRLNIGVDTRLDLDTARLKAIAR
jgi:uncharacterized protein